MAHRHILSPIGPAGGPRRCLTDGSLLRVESCSSDLFDVGRRRDRRSSRQASDQPASPAPQRCWASGSGRLAHRQRSTPCIRCICWPRRRLRRCDGCARLAALHAPAWHCRPSPARWRAAASRRRHPLGQPAHRTPCCVARLRDGAALFLARIDAADVGWRSSAVRWAAALAIRQARRRALARSRSAVRLRHPDIVAVFDAAELHAAPGSRWSCWPAPTCALHAPGAPAAEPLVWASSARAGRALAHAHRTAWCTATSSRPTCMVDLASGIVEAHRLRHRPRAPTRAARAPAWCSARRVHGARAAGRRARRRPQRPVFAGRACCSSCSPAACRIERESLGALLRAVAQRAGAATCARCGPSCPSAGQA